MDDLNFSYTKSFKKNILVLQNQGKAIWMGVGIFYPLLIFENINWLRTKLVIRMPWALAILDTEHLSQKH